MNSATSGICCNLNILLHVTFFTILQIICFVALSVLMMLIHIQRGFFDQEKKSMGKKPWGLITGHYGWAMSAEEICVATSEKISFDSQQLSIWSSASARA